MTGFRSSLATCGESAGWPRTELGGTPPRAEQAERRSSRKVGTPQGRELARNQAPRGDGKCNREQTADGPGRTRSQARVKRCGKGAPSSGATPADRQTPPGARPSRDQAARLMIPGRPLRWMATPTAPADGQNPAYRPAHRTGRTPSGPRCCRPVQPLSYPSDLSRYTT